MTLDATTNAALAAEPPEHLPPAAQDRPGRSSRSFVRQAVVDTLKSFGARIGLVWIALLVLAAVFAPLIASSYPLLVKESGHWSSPAIRQLAPADVTWMIAFAAAITIAVSRRFRFSEGLAALIWIVALTIPLTLWPSIRHGWRPGGDSIGGRFGVSVLILAAFTDLLFLVAIPLISHAERRTKLLVGVWSLPLIALLLLLPVNPPEANVYEEYRLKQNTGQIEWMLHSVIPYSPNDYERDQPDARLQPPSAQHWMGTEQSGADVFSRMLHACRIALSVGFISTGISVVIGVIVGGLMGYFAGLLDILGMRVIEIFESVPVLILLLTVSAFFGRNLYLMMAIIGLLSWTGYARFIRADFLTLRKQDFVQAAIAAGLPLRSIIFRHMMPNGITAVLVNTSFGVASAILIESTLSFLGLGLVDEPSWGQLLNQARAGGTGFQWWIATFPGLAIFLTVFAYNLIGEAVRDAIDPKLRKRD